MSRSLGVPVAIDDTGWLRCGVELRFKRRHGRTIHPISVRVGAHANVADVLALGDVRARCTRYNDVLGSLRTLRDQLRAILSCSELAPLRLCAARVRERHPMMTCRTHEPSGAVDPSYEDLLHLDELIARRQARCMGYGTVRVETLDLEIEFLRRQHARLAAGVLQLRDARDLFLGTRYRAERAPSSMGLGGGR